MPLWRGLATMRDPHRDISFWVEIAGAQANKIWEFRRQDYIKSYSLQNVPTFLLDCKDPFMARNGSPIAAKISLKCEKTPNGLLTCSKTSTRDKPVYYNKAVSYTHLTLPTIPLV